MSLAIKSTVNWYLAFLSLVEITSMINLEPWKINKSLPKQVSVNVQDLVAIAMKSAFLTLFKLFYLNGS